MEHMDPAQAQRVWQRVLAPRQENLQQLLVALGELMAQDVALYRKFPQKSRLFGRLLEQKQSQLGTLRGIYLIHQGSPMPPAKPQTTPPEQPLRAAVQRQLQILRVLDAQSGAEEFGPVFAALADHQREHLRLLMEVVGRG